MVKSLKVIFAGTPQFAAIALQNLIDSQHQIVAIYTNPDRPSGRGLKLTSSPVKELAHTYELPVYQPNSLKDDKAQKQLAQFNADVMVVAAYGMLLPPQILCIPKLGCVNIHPSLLPRWRGAAPIQRAIYAGDTITGVTIMQMDAGLDTGPVLLQKQYVMDPDETAQTLHDKLADLGAKALIEALDLLSENAINAVPQNNSIATYANKISKEEALIDWMLSAVELENQIRAFNPWPVSYTSWQGQNLRIWRAKAINETFTAEPRIILRSNKNGIDVTTSNGVLRLFELQLPGAKILTVADFYNAKKELLKPGEKFR